MLELMRSEQCSSANLQQMTSQHQQANTTSNESACVADENPADIQQQQQQQQNGVDDATHESSERVKAKTSKPHAAVQSGSDNNKNVNCGIAIDNALSHEMQQLHCDRNGLDDNRYQNGGVCEKQNGVALFTDCTQQQPSSVHSYLSNNIPNGDTSAHACSHVPDSSNKMRSQAKNCKLLSTTNGDTTCNTCKTECDNRPLSPSAVSCSATAASVVTWTLGTDADDDVTLSPRSAVKSSVNGLATEPGDKTVTKL